MKVFFSLLFQARGYWFHMYLLLKTKCTINLKKTRVLRCELEFPYIRIQDLFWKMNQKATMWPYPKIWHNDGFLINHNTTTYNIYKTFVEVLRSISMLHHLDLYTEKLFLFSVLKLSLIFQADRRMQLSNLEKSMSMCRNSHRAMPMAPVSICVLELWVRSFIRKIY